MIRAGMFGTYRYDSRTVNILILSEDSVFVEFLNLDATTFKTTYSVIASDSSRRESFEKRFTRSEDYTHISKLIEDMNE